MSVLTDSINVTALPFPVSPGALSSRSVRRDRFDPVGIDNHASSDYGRLAVDQKAARRTMHQGLPLGLLQLV
jgi:hypothetical protein